MSHNQYMKDLNISFTRAGVKQKLMSECVVSEAGLLVLCERVGAELAAALYLHTADQNNVIAAVTTAAARLLHVTSKS